MKQVAVTDLSTYLTLGATNIDGLSDGKLAGTNFTGSMILGHQTTGTLDAATYNTAVGITALDAITTSSPIYDKYHMEKYIESRRIIGNETFGVKKL